MALKLNTDKTDSCLNSYREVFSDPLKSGDDNAFNSGVILPLDFSLEMDGLSGIIPHSAFVIPSNSLPSSYIIQTGTDKGKQKIAFILHTIEQNFGENKWTTKITGQTLNIRFEPLTEAEKKQIQDAKDKQKSQTLSDFQNVGGESNTISNAQTAANQLQVKNLLKQSGLSKIAAAGVMGNIQKESIFNPKAINKKDTNGYPSLGLIQWNGKFINGGTKDANTVFSIIGNTVEAQINYLLNRYPTYKTWLREVRNSPNASDAAYLFAKTVEVCYGCNRGRDVYFDEPKYGAAERSKFATNFYNRFNDPTDTLYWG
jgi:hypothetical protein